VVGKRCCDVFCNSLCDGDCALCATMEDSRPIENRRGEIQAKDGRRIPVAVSTALLKDDGGAVIGAVEIVRDLSLVEELRKEISSRYSFGDIISKNTRLQQMLQLLPRIAESGSTVLITGESGTGKELVARAIHSLSPRKKKPFVAVNCGALPDTLLESELFGHVAGAFTDAKRDHKGYFAEAEAGTVFLDEIGDISAAMQVRLLRVLQERTYQPVGSSKPLKTDVRIICATNKDVEALVKQREFRQDLYYRLNVMRLKIPPLRDRKEDLPLLVEHFIAKLNRVRGRNVQGLSADATACLMAHDWPGNVRELENAIEHAFVLCDGPTLSTVHLPEGLRPQEAHAPPPGTSLAQVEARAIYDALKRNGWRKLATARELRINKTTLWRRIKALGIRLPPEVE
jgi:transcriptional regulator with PAS, ATPase and Fis domain